MRQAAVRYSSVRREKRLSLASGQQRLTLLEPPPVLQEPVQRAFSFEEAIAVIAERLDRLHSGQNLLSAQVKDLRESLPVQRRPASHWTRAMHISVVQSKRNGFCPCCQKTRIVNEEGSLPCLQIDHWFARNRAYITETWAVCSDCNASLNNPDFKTAHRSAFESYQVAVRLALHERQHGQTNLMGQSAAG